jgi:hypothetical protein
METWSNFFNAVVKMRRAQKAYFAKPSYSADKDQLLRIAKDAEKIVDKAIAGHNARVENVNNPSLFGEAR